MNTALVKSMKKRLERYDTDPYKDSRLQMQKCRFCMYLDNRIALQAFTEFTCKNCNKSFMHHNSNIDEFCKECADELNVCVSCGAKMENESKEEYL